MTRNDLNNSLLTLSLGFTLGLFTATHLLRLRDRERLRKACSRTQKHLIKGQRAALGVDLTRCCIPNISKGKSRQRVVVLGAGAFGTAMAYAACQGGNEVVIYMRDARQCEVMNREHRNSKYLTEFSLHVEGEADIRGICTLEELKEELAVPGVVIIHALPCQLTPPWFREHKDLIPKDALICVTAKGLYLPTQQLMGHAILDALDRAEQPLAFLSGPSFASEIMKGDPTTLVVASDQLFQAVRIQRIMNNFKTLRVFTSDDPVGVQLGGALKNPLAVGAGMISGMGCGTNTLSAVVTRASGELRELCIAMGGNPRTIDGLAGTGDLMLTCFSPQSRNQRCGQRLIHGERVEDIQNNTTVEGIATADVAIVYADMCGLELPIFRCVHALIHKKITPEEAIADLMGRPIHHEVVHH
ncbi:hypothetical protein ACHAWO_001226 [Cyclotella atomus]|uniref:Glycerol-3-phosphate dehydrogenase [NAD(+)] n=1 Tax=Cyclotella atomus TaxID=382360 RepID=A0ABD3P7Z8_9STRA